MSAGEESAVHLRFVKFTVPPERLARFRELYETRVVPDLAATRGCRSARLIQDAAEPSSCLSLTVWESAADADAYADSGLYDRLLDATDEALVDTRERRLPVTERAPLPDPEIESFSVRLLREPASAPFLRLVALQVEPGRSEDFRRRFEETVLPGLLATPGCQGIALAEADRPTPAFLSVTYWASEEDAVRYEASGRFDQLTASLRDLLSGIYQWRLSLSPGTVRKVEGRDLEVRGYRVVAGGVLR